MTAFAYELASVLSAQQQVRPGDPYTMPWYVVIGEPGTGRSSAIKAINLNWPHGESALNLNLPEPLCSYWLPEKAVYLEPGAKVLGPDRDPALMRELCAELTEKRPREPVDGTLLVVNAGMLIDADERGAEAYAKTLRTYLVELSRYLSSDIPVYVVVSSIDTLWGFGDVFLWSADRTDEEPWGFSLRVGTPATQVKEPTLEALEGLQARLESMCFAKLSTEDAADSRARAFQHLAEIHLLITRLRELLNIVTLANAYERSPWFRGLAIGSAIPGTGHRLRTYAAEFIHMGLHTPPQSGTPNPGGMPIHAILDNVLLPERELVPLKTRWLSDPVFFWVGILGIVLAIVAVAAAVVLSLV